MTESVAISKLVESLLGEDRDSLNSRFRQRVRQGAQIDPDQWMRHVQNRIGPIVDAVGRILPERCRLVLNELYDISLELFSFGHFGDGTSALHFFLVALWEKTLPRLAPVLARDPRRVAGSLSNGMLFVAQARPECAVTWLDHVTTAGPLAESSDQLMQIGQVAAWVSGLAEYRAAAIETARELPANIRRMLLGVPEETDESQLREFLNHLALDPWARLVVASAGETVEQVAGCGAFRGFGGVLMAPPRVFAVEKQLYVTDGTDTWQMFADRFGSSLLRSGLSPDTDGSRPPKGAPQLDATGNVRWNNWNVALEDLAHSTSQAFDGTTFAVTIPGSFHVFLLARPTIAGNG